MVQDRNLRVCGGTVAKLLELPLIWQTERHQSPGFCFLSVNALHGRRYAQRMAGVAGAGDGDIRANPSQEYRSNAFTN